MEINQNIAPSGIKASEHSPYMTSVVKWTRRTKTGTYLVRMENEHTAELKKGRPIVGDPILYKVVKEISNGECHNFFEL